MATTLTEAALLRLTWLASPALPVGGFSYSEGLEAAVEAGLVRDEQSAGDWLVDQLHLALARGDLAVVAAVAREPQRAGELDAWVRQTRETSELRLQSEQMGKSLSDWRRSLDAAPVGWVRAATPAECGENAGVPAATQPTGSQPVDSEPAPSQPTDNQLANKHPPTYPVAFALSAAATGAPLNAILLSFAFGWCENMMQAAIKAVPLGQSAGQRILARLADEIPQAAAHATQAEPQAFSPMLAILSARHETQYSRLFRS